MATYSLRRVRSGAWATFPAEIQRPRRITGGASDLTAGTTLIGALNSRSEDFPGSRSSCLRGKPIGRGDHSGKSRMGDAKLAFASAGGRVASRITQMARRSGKIRPPRSRQFCRACDAASYEVVGLGPLRLGAGLANLPSPQCRLLLDRPSRLSCATAAACRRLGRQVSARPMRPPLDAQIQFAPNKKGKGFQI